MVQIQVGPSQVAVVLAFDPRTWETEFSEFKASLLHRAEHSRTVKATQTNPVLKNKNKIQVGPTLLWTFFPW